MRSWLNLLENFMYFLNKYHDRASVKSKSLDVGNEKNLPLDVDFTRHAAIL